MVRSWDTFARSFKHRRDCQVLVRIERIQPRRSLQQLRWYWGVIVQAISDHTGYTPDEVHELLKAKFIPKKMAVCDGNGEIKDELVIGGSTSKLTTEAMAEYCDDIRRWAAMDLGVVIPDPE